MNFIARHGDVVITKVASLPANLKEIEIRPLAFGEITGHSHRVVATNPDLTMYEDKDGWLYFKVGSSAQVVHEEHKTITLEPGIYTTRIIREFDYVSQEIEKIKD